MSTSDSQPRVLLLDIEGTTTPIAFVHERLFTYARAHLSAYVTEHWNDPDMRRVRDDLTAEHQSDGRGQLEGSDSLIAHALELMSVDRKSPGLKYLQGLIWEDGYRAGELHGQVWADVPAAMRRWSSAGKAIAIYSSGSALAQRLLFQSTEHGDLTPLISAFFDTAVGAKGDAASYTRIAEALKHPPGAILFVSDVTAELRAARSAGLQVVLSVRPGNPPQADAKDFQQINSFEEL